MVDSASTSDSFPRTNIQLMSNQMMKSLAGRKSINAYGDDIEFFFINISKVLKIITKVQLNFIIFKNEIKS